MREGDEETRDVGYEQCRGDVIDLVQKWFEAYPEDIFLPPKPGHHGDTVDGCSAAMGRHMAKALLRQVRDLKRGGEE